MTLPTGRVYTARVYKRLATNPAIMWANTYEILGPPGDPQIPAMITGLLPIGTWEAEFHMTDVEFDRIVVSTYVPDGDPYDPFTFGVGSLTGLLGQRAYPSGDQTTSLPLDVCLRVRKDVPVGRAGYWLYRRCLTTADVRSPAGTADLNTASAASIQALIDAASLPGGTSLLDYLGDEFGSPLVMAGGNPEPTNIRTVLDLNVAGVTVKDWNNAYFDKGATTPP